MIDPFEKGRQKINRVSIHWYLLAVILCGIISMVSLYWSWAAMKTTGRCVCQDLLNESTGGQRHYVVA